MDQMKKMVWSFIQNTHIFDLNQRNRYVATFVSLCIPNQSYVCCYQWSQRSLKPRNLWFFLLYKFNLRAMYIVCMCITLQKSKNNLILMLIYFRWAQHWQIIVTVVRNVLSSLDDYCFWKCWWNIEIELHIQNI